MTARAWAWRPARTSEELAAAEKTPAKVWALGSSFRWVLLMSRKRGKTENDWDLCWERALMREFHETMSLVVLGMEWRTRVALGRWPHLA